VRELGNTNGHGNRQPAFDLGRDAFWRVDPMRLGKPLESRMSSIHGVGNQNAVQRVVSNPVQRQVPAEAPRQLPVTDKLELSGMSHLLRALKNNDVRTDKVAAIRAQIEAGTYENDAKLNSAVDRLLDDLDK
jgi:anti-sigma28 factor (negative regulator of flagellin synthesis)